MTRFYVRFTEGQWCVIGRCDGVDWVVISYATREAAETKARELS